MEERGNKTIICSVFFLDIVEYSKKSVSGQISLKERFNAFLSIAIREVPINDRIILDTGDGAAISFLGDIEDALQAALSMRSSLLNEGVRMEPPLLVRMGINLGPVRLVKDINGQPNIVGDGINVAQRVMGFADPGQILVSRSYYDAVSRLSQEYAGMFHYQGSRTDKHVREHEVYAIGYPGEFTSTQQLMSHGVARTGLLGAFEKGVQKGRQYFYRLNSFIDVWSGSIKRAFQEASGKKKALYIAVAGLCVILLISLIVKLALRPAPVKLPEVAVSPKAVVTSLSPVIANVSAPIESRAKQAAETEISLGTGKPELSKQERQHQKTAKQFSRVRTLEETIGKPVLISLSIVPWGEVYLDGKKQGVSPPLQELQVFPGVHVIKVTNSDFPVMVKKIVGKSGEQIKVKHKFGN
jgi:hypothetical protein